MPELFNNTSNISLTKNDILNMTRNKKDFVSIEEYEEFACQARNKIKILMSNFIKIRQAANVQKVEILKSMSNGSSEFKTAQYALSQIEFGLSQINQNILYFQEVRKSLNYIDKKIDERRQKEITTIKSEQTNENRKFNYTTCQSSSNKSNNKNQTNLSYHNQLNEERKTHNNDDKLSNVNLNKKDGDKNNKGEKTNKPNQASNPKNKSYIYKVKPKPEINILKNKIKKFNKILLVAVFLIQNSQIITRNLRGRRIRAHSHESDFSPPFHVKKNFFL